MVPGFAFAVPFHQCAKKNIFIEPLRLALPEFFKRRRLIEFLKCRFYPRTLNASYISVFKLIYILSLRSIVLVFRVPICVNLRNLEIKFFSPASLASLRRACSEFLSENGTAAGTHRHNRRLSAYADSLGTARPSRG